MTTLADFRTAVRNMTGLSLIDRGGLDAQIDAAVTTATLQYSLALPQVARAGVAIAGGTRTYDLAPVARLMHVTAVEYPLDQLPATTVDYTVDGNLLTIHHRPPAAPYNVRLHHTLYHLVEATSSTIPTHHEHLITLGAAGYAWLNRAGASVDAAQTAAAAPQTYQPLRLAQEYLREFDRQLARLRRHPRSRILYSPTGRGVSASIASEPY